MSSLDQIKAQVRTVAQQATTLAGQLTQISSKLTPMVGQITQAIGGTSDGADQEMALAFQQADASVKQAAGLMQIAAQKANDWASKA